MVPVVVIEQQGSVPALDEPQANVGPVWSCPALWVGVTSMVIAVLAVLLAGRGAPRWEVGACVDGESDASVLPVSCTSRHIGAVVAVVTTKDACPFRSEGVVTVEPGRYACVSLRDAERPGTTQVS